MRTVSRREALAAGAGILTTAGLAAVATAQPPGAAPGQMMGGGLDTAFALCLLAKGRKQIEVCRFAQTKLQNDDAKKFAQAEIDEHEHIRQRLEQLGYAYPTNVPTAQAGGGGIAQAGGVQVMVGRMPLPPGMAAWAPVEHALMEQCIATEKAELGKLEGVKFDAGFIGCQLAAHYGLWDHDVVFRKFASPQLAPVLDEARPVIERHLATCKEIKEKLHAMKEKNAT